MSIRYSQASAFASVANKQLSYGDNSPFFLPRSEKRMLKTRGKKSPYCRACRFFLWGLIVVVGTSFFLGVVVDILLYIFEHGHQNFESWQEENSTSLFYIGVP